MKLCWTQTWASCIAALKGAHRNRMILCTSVLGLDGCRTSGPQCTCRLRYLCGVRLHLLLRDAGVGAVIANQIVLPMSPMIANLHTRTKFDCQGACQDVAEQIISIPSQRFGGSSHRYLNCKLMRCALQREGQESKDLPSANSCDHVHICPHRCCQQGSTQCEVDKLQVLLHWHSPAHHVFFEYTIHPSICGSNGKVGARICMCACVCVCVCVCVERWGLAI